MDNKVFLLYLLKMVGIHSLELLKISKPICHYLLSHEIIIAAEYLPSKLNSKQTGSLGISGIPQTKNCIKASSRA